MNHSRNHTKRKSEVIGFLENIYYTDRMTDELHHRRDQIRDKLFRLGVLYEDGEYIFTDLCDERVRELCDEVMKLEENIIKHTHRLISKQKAATNLLSKLPDYRHRLVLIKRYIDNKPVEIIADEMGYSPRHVQRIMKEATDAVEEMYRTEIRDRINKPKEPANASPQE